MTAEIHVQPVFWQVRIYPKGGGYPGPFIGVATVQSVGPQTIYVSAMHGTVTRTAIEEAALYFMSLGFKKVLRLRRGKITQKSLSFYVKKNPSLGGAKGH